MFSLGRQKVSATVRGQQSTLGGGVGGYYLGLDIRGSEWNCDWGSVRGLENRRRNEETETLWMLRT